MMSTPVDARERDVSHLLIQLAIPGPWPNGADGVVPEGIHAVFASGENTMLAEGRPYNGIITQLTQIYLQQW